MNFPEERAAALRIAAERLGLELGNGAYVTEHWNGDWRIGVIGDGRAPTFDPATALQPSVELRVVYVSEEDIYAERPA